MNPNPALWMVLTLGTGTASFSTGDGDLNSRTTDTAEGLCLTTHTFRNTGFQHGASRRPLLSVTLPIKIKRYLLLLVIER